MKYILVKWKHSNANEPVLLYSELDENRWETRKVEVYTDGRKGYASKTGYHGKTGLGKVPVPPLAEIATDREFEPVEISNEEFERVWASRKHTT